ncbi:MAG: hypothetical protein IH945_04950 [Armatimonadetes bacterium]|nr:hypothetical protein [Armatimonadota bacterium]
MNSAHLHIVLNHFPIIGTFIALMVAAVAIVTKQAVIKRLVLGMMVLIAVTGAAAYFTGLATEEDFFGPGSPALEQVERHEASARVTWIVGLVAGAVGIGGLVISRRLNYVQTPVDDVQSPVNDVQTPVNDVQTPIMATAILVLLVCAFFFMRTGNLGGQISHPEIRSDPVSKALAPD